MMGAVIGHRQSTRGRPWRREARPSPRHRRDVVFSRPRGSTAPSIAGLADLDEPELVAMVDGNRATDLRRWCSALDLLWLEVVKVVAMLSPCASGALSRTP